ncbi:MAG: hypothetical protein Q7T19_15725 [Caulobacter sp.]|nr:hypothetical protein [Caulobacter sp.]
MLPLLLVVACGDGGRPVWKTEPSKPLAVAGYLTPPRVLAVRAAQGGTALAGLAAPGARVRLGEPDGQLRYATADGSGLWTIVVPPSAGPRLFGLAMVVDGRTVQAEGYLALTPDGRAAQLRAGGGTLVLAPPSRRPRILALDFDRDGAAMISGVGTVGAEIGLRLDRAAAGGSAIDRQGRFSFALSRPMSSASHELEISGEGGEDVLVVATGRPDPLDRPFRASRLAGAWRIDWMTPGGGAQTTLLFDAPATSR